MTVVVMYKWAANPQDAAVGADGAVDWSRAKASISEYDPTAIELGRAVADAASTELVGVTVGRADAGSPLAKKNVMSRGLDRGIVMADDAVASWNVTDVARALAALIERVADADLVLAGDISVDEGIEMVPALTAGFLGWPSFQKVSKVEKSASGWIITQGTDEGERTIEVTGPVVISVASDAVKARVPGMKDIMAAGKKPVEIVALSDVPGAESSLQITGTERPAAAKRQGRIFEGPTAAADLVAALRADALI